MNIHVPDLRDPNTDPLNGFGQEHPAKKDLRHAMMRKFTMLQGQTHLTIPNPKGKTGVVYTQSAASQSHALKEEVSHVECPARLEKVLEWAEKKLEEGEMIRLDIPRVEGTWMMEVVQTAHPSTLALLSSATRMLEDDVGEEGVFQREKLARLAKRMGLIVGGDDLEVYVTPATHEAALQAAFLCMGAALRLQQTFNHVIALVRPPGHHAGRLPSGFCLYNNAFLAASAGLGTKLWTRVAIVDCDVHHGNGTQQLAWSRSDILTISSHIANPDFFPHHTGYATELGEPGEAWGANLNVPLDTTSSKLRNADFEYIATRLVEPALVAYRPSCIILSMGADIMKGDKLTGKHTDATEVAIWHMAAACVRAAAMCDSKFLCITEGGYTAANMKKAVERVQAAIESRGEGGPSCGAGHKRARVALAQLRAEMVSQLKRHKGKLYVKRTANAKHVFNVRETVLRQLEECVV